MCRQMRGVLSGMLAVLLASSFLTHAFAADEYDSNSSNVSIPDAGGWVYSRIDISGAPAGATITGIDVYFDIEHTYASDLVVDLEVGTYSNSERLWDREGGSSANPSRTTSTSEFNGLPVNNSWYLYACDYVSGDSGDIDRWWIRIYYDEEEPTTYSLTPSSTTVDEGVGSITFTVSRSGGKPAETIYASTTQTEGDSNNGDYTGLLNEPINFSDGETSDPVTVNITDDSSVEDSETFGLIIQRNTSDPVSTYLDKSTFTIDDNDVLPTTYSLAPTSTTVDEDVGTVTFTLSRSGGKPAETVYASTAQTEGDSNNGDYTGLLNEPINFSDGETSDPVTISITDDSSVEDSETFGLIIQRNTGDPVSTYVGGTTTTTLVPSTTVAPTTTTLSPTTTTVDPTTTTVAATTTSLTPTTTTVAPTTTTVAPTTTTVAPTSTTTTTVDTRRPLSWLLLLLDSE